jgi:hypothetical protein
MTSGFNGCRILTLLIRLEAYSLQVVENLCQFCLRQRVEVHLDIATCKGRCIQNLSEGICSQLQFTDFLNDLVFVFVEEFEGHKGSLTYRLYIANKVKIQVNRISLEKFGELLLKSRIDCLTQLQLKKETDPEGSVFVGFMEVAGGHLSTQQMA